MKILHMLRFTTAARALMLGSALLLVLGGCASTPVPTSQMAVAEASVQNANSSNTSEHAPGELQIAIAKLASARDAMSRKDYVEARRLAEQAELDARVAQVRAQSVSARKAAQESQEAARVLREELNRNTYN